MLQSLKNLFFPSPLQGQAHDAYVTLVAQSRNPFFYKDCAVPDTVDGRFDVMALHLFMVIHRLRGETLPEAGEFIRALTEAFFADMDRSLREMGVGDTGVSHRIKKMAQAFYGRLTAYEQTILKPDTFIESLQRNLYRGAEVEKKNLKTVMDYVLKNAGHLAKQDIADITDGKLSFLEIKQPNPVPA